MKENKECEVVQDLLPSYVDKLTSEQTNGYIENHLKECEKCSKVLKNMQDVNKEIEEQKLKRDLKFAKKYNRKLMFFKVIVLAILVGIVFALTRNVLIVQKLIKTNEDLGYISSYYTRVSVYDEDIVLTYENWMKDETYLGKMKWLYKYEDAEGSLVEYWDGVSENSKSYWLPVSGEKLKYESEPGNVIMLGRPQATITLFKEMDVFTFIKVCASYKITNANCNGIECYKIEPIGWFDDVNYGCFYVDKNTGFTVRTISGIYDTEKGEYSYGQIHDFYYELNSVSDEEVEEPVLEGYEPLEN